MARKKILGAANDDNSNKPWVSNYPPLEAWLEKHDARYMYQLPTSPRPEDDTDWQPNAYVEMHLINGRPCIVTIHANKMGWEIYTPLNSNKIAETLADAEQRLGLTKNEGETRLTLRPTLHSIGDVTSKYDGQSFRIVGALICHETEHQETLVRARFEDGHETDVFLDEAFTKEG